MFKHYIKIAWRNLQKHKLYTFVNISGLTVGIASCILIGLYITQELSYDKFHAKSDRIVRVTMDYGGADKGQQTAMTGTKVGPQFKRSFPVVESFVRTIKYDGLVTYGDQSFKEHNILFADSSFFSMFSFPLLKGDAISMLNAPNQVVITESMAKKYFGSQDPIGKALKVFNTRNYTVVGIAKDAPDNSQIKFDMVVSFTSMGASKTEEWWTANYITYLQVNKPENIEPLQTQIKAYMKTDQPRREAKLDGGSYLTYFLEPLVKVHLHSSLAGLEPNGNIKYVYILSAIAILILTIACVNYTNLATAQSESRKGEISIRKVLGAGKVQLLRQHLGESFLITFIALALAVLACVEIIPFFNQITDKHLTISSILSPLPLLSLLILGALVSLMAGAYPALILSNLKLMELLKSGFRSSQAGGGLRRSLIVFQFVIAVFLIISTIFISRQLSFIRNKQLGYDKDHVIVLPIIDEISKNYEAFKAAVKRDPQVMNVGGASGNPTYVQWTDGLNSSVGKEKPGISIKAIPADRDFVRTMGMQLVAGTDFTQADSYTLDTTNDYKNYRYTFILNESAVKELGWTPQEAVGKTVVKNLPGTIKAVVKDFHFASMHESIGPLMIFLNDEFLNNLYVRVSGKSLQASIEHLQALWKERVPAYPFEYHFLDEDYNALYKVENRTGQIFSIFAVTAVLLACLGLFALAAFSTVQRTKEIGIRKVLGASLASITFLLSWEFLKLVAIAALIAFPLSWWAVSQWLEDFAYRIPVSLWVFGAAFALALVVALATVSFQALRAGLANPIKSLRSE